MPTETKTPAPTPSPSPAKPLRRDAEENRRRLLEAAREVFAVAGFEATMDQVAAHAGVGVGTAYRRFANKDELIAALFDDRLAEIHEVVERALAAEDPWQGVVTYVEDSVALQACDRGLKEMFLSSPRGHEFVEKARAELKPRIDELIERAHRAGALRPGVETTDLVAAQLMLTAAADPAGKPGAESWRRFLPLVLDGLGAHHRTPLPGRALSLDELDAVMEAAQQPRR